MSDEKPKIKLQFAPLDPKTDERGKNRKQSPVVELRNGDYYRKFEAKDAPFEITGVTHTDQDSQGKDREVVDMTAEDEAGMLIRSGHFVLVDEGAKAETADTPTPPKSAAKPAASTE